MEKQALQNHVEGRRHLTKCLVPTRKPTGKKFTEEKDGKSIEVDEYVTVIENHCLYKKRVERLGIK
jgi:hypothetical protein